MIHHSSIGYDTIYEHYSLILIHYTSMETSTQQSWLDTPKAILLGALIIGLGLALGIGLSGSKNTTRPAKDTSVPVAQVLKKANINEDDYQACVKDGAFSQRVADDLDRGFQSGVTGTPGTIIVHVPTGKSVLLAGAQPINVFQQVIAGLRAGQVDEFPLVDGDFTLDADEHIIGNPEGDIIMFEWSDYDCPFCERVHPTLNQLVANDENIAWAYRHFPLQSHPEAFPKAVASECFAELGGNEAFWLFTETEFSEGVRI